MKLWPLLLALSTSICQAADLISSGTSVEIHGDIIQGDAGRIIPRLRALSPGVVVRLNSQGGSVVDAMQIGVFLHRRWLDTYVVSGHECFSACALIWIAGRRRLASREAMIGFHALNLTPNDVPVAKEQAFMRTYMRSYGLPEKVIQEALRKKAWEIRSLTRDEALQMKVQLTR